MIRKRKLTMAIVGIVLIIGLSVGFLIKSFNVKNVNEVFADNYSDSYYAGDEISLINKKVLYGDKQYDASVLLITPDGNGQESNSVVLSQVGTYTVEYRFYVDGKLRKTTESFTVLQNLYEVSSERSSAEYTEYSDTENDVTLTSQGILVNLASGDKFTYNKIINLSDNTQYEQLLSLFVIPNTKGDADLYKLNVVFTDIYDEDNYVTVTFKTGEKGTQNLISGKHYYEYKTYMSANSAKQLSTGIDRNDSGTFEYNGNMYYKWVSHAQYGYMFSSSFYGSNATVKYYVDQATGTVSKSWLEYSPIGSMPMEIYFDYESKQIHGSKTTPNPTTLVCDLDDSAFFSEIWKGFTTGEVKMSISGENYVSSTAKFMITNIDGQDISSKTLVDEVAPQLTIDTLGYTEDYLPIAKKGLPYTVFAAKAIDNYDGNVEVLTNVYYNYNSNTCVNVELKDNVFTPDRAGRYTIVYTAADSSGNIVKKELYVTATDGAEFKLNFDETSATSGKVGVEFKIPDYKVFGNSGNVDCIVTAKHKVKGVEYSVIDGSFIPMYVGEYELIYEYNDYLENKTVVKNFVAENSDTPTILDNLTLPKYLLKNCIYKLDDIVGYAFENGEPIEKETVITVTENGNTRPLVNNYFAPQVSGDVTITYTVTNGENSFSKSFNATVVDAGYADRITMENYFVGDLNTASNSSHVQLFASNEGTSSFALPLQVYEFTSKMQIDTEKNSFKKLSIKMQDTVDSEVYVVFNFISTKSGTVFSVNDDDFLYSLGYDAFNSELESIVLNYYNETKQVTFNENTFITVSTDADGNVFTGFTDNKAYVSFTLDEIEADGEAGILVYQINGQPFSNGTVDKIKPQLFIMNKDSGLKQIGDKIYISPAFAFDVLDPNIDVSFAVYDPDGKLCTGDDGVLLAASADYTKGYYVTAKKIGSYVVRYQVSDKKGNKLTDSYAIRVADKEAPVISVKAPVATAKVGDKITLYEATATDNVSETVTIKMYVYYPDGHTEELTGVKTFTPSLKGVYRITYMALDDLQNVSFKTFEIVVS